jgi:hypothetical protein
MHLPPDAFSRAITGEVDEPMFLVAVERVDGVVQTTLGILVRMGRERVVNPRRPGFFLERG